jgi:hypothetical protein
MQYFHASRWVCKAAATVIERPPSHCTAAIDLLPFTMINGLIVHIVWLAVGLLLCAVTTYRDTRAMTVHFTDVLQIPLVMLDFAQISLLVIDIALLCVERVAATRVSCLALVISCTLQILFWANIRFHRQALYLLTAMPAVAPCFATTLQLLGQNADVPGSNCLHLYQYCALFQHVCQP